jgi:hypothetical protein
MLLHLEITLILTTNFIGFWDARNLREFFPIDVRSPEYRRRLPMSQQFDAVIIGAGITGTAIAYELSKKGYQTLNIDKLPAAGHGSTGNTCAIIRTHYSTLEGTALAYDSYHRDIIEGSSFSVLG